MRGELYKVLAREPGAPTYTKNTSLAPAGVLQRRSHIKCVGGWGGGFASIFPEVLPEGSVPGSALSCKSSTAGGE